MATVTSAAVSIPSFTGLKAASPKAAATTTVKMVAPPVSPRLVVKASLKQLGAAVIATAATALFASNVLAAEVLAGDDDGGLAFVPSELSVASGETIVFKNNKAFPHNIVFDEDAIPAGVDAGKISMSEEDLLNGPGDTYSVTLTEKGTYSYYCSPHQGAGMVGKITVN